MTVPALDAWHALSLTSRRIHVFGDSIPGWNDDGTINYIQRLRTSLVPYFGYGGHGFYALSTGLLPRADVLKTGTWNQASAPRKAPLGYTYLANGSGNKQKLTNPSNATTDSVDLIYEDRSGAADFSYSINGGSFINSGGTFTAGGALRKINIPVSSFSTLEVRAANAAGTAVNLYFVGFRLLYGSTGLIIDDLAWPGLSILNFADSNITLSAFPTLYPPDLVIINSSNDYQYTNAVNGPLLSTLLASISVPVLLICDPEQVTPDRPAADQENWRELSKNKVKAAGGAILDMSKFWGPYATAYAAGLWSNIFAVHPSDIGYQDFETRVLKLLTEPRAGGRGRV